jgi:membrane protein required for colicin V production
MTWLDYAVLGVTVVSILWGVWRGLVREVISLAGWVVAFLAANLFAGPLSAALPAALRSPELRVLIAFVAIFFASLVLAGLVALLLSRLAKAAGLAALDRALGALFGLCRAALIVAAFALLAGLTALPHHPLWTHSVSGKHLARLALALKPALPPALADRVRYD